MSAELNGMPASEIGLLLVLQCRSNIQADNVTTFKSTLDAFHIKQRKNDTDWCVRRKAHLFSLRCELKFLIQGVSEGIVNILGGGSMDYSE
jgi:hypothetical protein